MKTCFASVVAVLATHASAATLDFTAYSDGSSVYTGIAVSGVLSATDTSFTIALSNNSTQGTMTSFYIEMGMATSTLGSPTIQNGTGTSFIVETNPTTPQGGINGLPGGVWQESFFSMERTSGAGGVGNGMDPGETVTIVFAHDGNFSLDALIDAIENNDIRMAMKYQRLGTDAEGSAWLIGGLRDVAVVPLPPAAWAGLAILAGLGGLRTVKRRQR